MTWKQSVPSNIQLWSQGNETVTKPKKIANLFNDEFSTIAEKTKAKN